MSEMSRLLDGATVAEPPGTTLSTNPPAAPSGAGRSGFPSCRELTVMAFVLTGLATALLLPHIRQGGFYTDDWENASLARFDPHGLLHILLPDWTNPGNRPLLLVYQSIMHAVLGLHQHAYIAFTVLTAIGLSLALFLTLRTIGLERLHAGIIASLVLLFPYADATHLWFSATDSNVTITLYLLGVTTALHGLDRNCQRAVLYHIGALALYAASILIYESTATAIIVTGALYWWRTGRRAALPRWAADVAVVLILLFGFSRNTGILRLHGLSEITSHARMIYDQLLTLFTHTVFPLNASRTLILVLVALLLVGAREVSWHLSRDDLTRSRLTRWIWIALAGLTMTAVTGTIYAPAVPYYSPLQLGIGNRVNALPAVGLVIAAYGVYMIVGTLASCGVAFASGRGRIVDARLASVVAVVLALLTGVRFAHLVRVDASSYDLASRYQLQMLDALHASLPQPAHDETIFTFGAPAYTAPGVPVFAASWDLDGAVQVTYDDPTINAYPIILGSTITCTARGIDTTVAGPGIVAPYGHVVLFDLATGDVSRPTRATQCAKALPAFVPGQLTVLPPPAV
jgi:hypothetical protein